MTEYRIAPGWKNALRWAVLRRVRPFSRRAKVARLIGWPRTEAVKPEHYWVSPSGVHSEKVCACGLPESGHPIIIKRYRRLSTP